MCAGKLTRRPARCQASAGRRGADWRKKIEGAKPRTGLRPLANRGTWEASRFATVDASVRLASIVVRRVTVAGGIGRAIAIADPGSRGRLTAQLIDLCLELGDLLLQLAELLAHR